MRIIKIVFFFTFIIHTILSSQDDKILKSNVYPNGQKKYIGNFINDSIRIGKWKFFYESGNIFAEGNYDKNGTRNGDWIFYYDYPGNISHKGKYFKGKNEDFLDRKIGKWIFFYQSGNIWSEGNYDKSGTRNGDWVFYFDNSGKIREKGKYFKSKEGNLSYGKIDKWIFFYQSGNIWGEGNYDKTGTRDGDWIFYYDYPGKIKEKGKYFKGKDGDLLDGRVGKWLTFDNNKLYKEINYIIDTAKDSTGRLYFCSKSNGEYKEYHENGELLVIGNYFKNAKIGKWKVYNMNKILLEEKYYLIDTDSVFKNIKNIDCNKTNNISYLSGLYRSWDNDSNLYKIGYIEKGQKIGIWKTFSSSGKLISIEKYCHGALKKSQRPNLTHCPNCFHNSSHFMTVADALDKEVKEYGVLDSIQSYYNEEGKTISILTYNAGVLNGPIISFDDYGDTLWSCYYINGRLNGWHKRWGYDSERTWFKKKIVEVKYYSNDTASLHIQLLQNDTIEKGYFKNNLKDGIWHTYSFGIDKEIVNYSKGKKNGLYSVFNNEGFEVVHGNYLNDKQHGNWLVFDNQKRILFKGQYKIGKQDGNCYYSLPVNNNEKPYIYDLFGSNEINQFNYHHERMSVDTCTINAIFENGNLKMAEGFYKNNLKWFEKKYINDTLKEKAYFANGKIMYEIMEYYDLDSGFKVTKYIYDTDQLGNPSVTNGNGQLIEKKNGLIINSIEIKNGYKEGEWISYSSDGAFVRKWNFVKGIPQ